MPRTPGLDDAGTDRVLRLLRSPVTVGVPGMPARGSGMAPPQVRAQRQSAGFVPSPPPGYPGASVASRVEPSPRQEPASLGSKRGGRHRSPPPRLVTVPAVLRGGPRDIRSTAILASSRAASRSPRSSVPGGASSTGWSCRSSWSRVRRWSTCSRAWRRRSWTRHRSPSTWVSRRGSSSGSRWGRSPT